MSKLPLALAAAAVILSCWLPQASAQSLCHQKTLGYYRDCKEAYYLGQTYSGVYTIKPDNLPPFEAYCDMETDGGGWTVFQRRMDGTQYFYYSWGNYVRGFGEMNREFWLGLSQLERLTKTPTELRVDLVDFSNSARFAKYRTFKVGPLTSNYTLTVSGYSGTAGDSLTYHNNMEFSTRYRDNDVSSNNCAEHCKGAWWFRSCHYSNLNGLYLSEAHSPSNHDGVRWYYNFRGDTLKISEMKLRRV